MKKTLVMLALSTVGFAPVFAAATTPQTQPQQPASAQQTPAKTVEVKKIAGQTSDQKTPATPSEVKKIAGQTSDQKTPTTPVTSNKTKMVLVAAEKPCNCPTDKKDLAVDMKKDDQKTPAQTPAKTTPAKVALA
jgi:hypothetical protein